MKRLGVITPNDADTTSFYRGMGPLSQLTKITPFEIVSLNKLHWATLSQVDALFMLRPITKEHVKIIRMAKAMNIKTWVDNDDDLLSVPIDNSSSELYDNEGVRAAYTQCMQLADIVSVQGNILKRKYDYLNSNIVDIPNALDVQTYGRYHKEKTERTKIVLWRGSDTHMKDVYYFRKPIIKAMEANPNWTIVFMGMYPFYIFDELPERQCRFIRMLEPLEYIQLIHKINPDVMIVPLDDNPFNRVKSNISWIEGTSAGAAVLKPNWDNWTYISYSYKNHEDFGEKLLEMMKPGAPIESVNLESWDHIKNFLSLDQTNLIRKEVLNSLW